MEKSPHRKTVQHFNEPGHAHLLTFSCYRRMAIFSNDLWRTWFSENLDQALEKHQFQLSAFVYMPEHLHLLVFPTSGNYHIDKLLFSIKRPTSVKIKQSLPPQSNLLKTLTIRDRPGHTSFRYWQEGPGHDRNLISVENCVKAAEYLHNNPVRRTLCSTPDRWKWSSWKFYHCAAEYRTPPLPRVHGFPV
jgi:putative transposase